MEHEGWKKDENPYIVFACLKCKQYMYVKATQKTKKCLRCGRRYKVPTIINSGEFVKGMAKAVDMVKTRQNELAIKELGNVPEFRAGDDFNVKSRPQKVINVDINNDDGDLSTQFTAMLHEISSSYSLFPFYVLEIMAENFGIPLLELKILVKNYQQKGILIHLEDGSYKICKIFKRN